MKNGRIWFIIGLSLMAIGATLRLVVLFEKAMTPPPPPQPYYFVSYTFAETNVVKINNFLFVPNPTNRIEQQDFNEANQVVIAKAGTNSAITAFTPLVSRQ